MYIISIYYNYYIEYLLIYNYIKALESYIAHVFNIVILFKLDKYITQPLAP